MYKTCVNNGMNYQPQLVIAGFCPLTVLTSSFSWQETEVRLLENQVRCIEMYWGTQLGDGRTREELAEGWIPIMGMLKGGKW